MPEGVKTDVFSNEVRYVVVCLFFSHLRVNETLSGMHGVHSRVPVWLWRAPRSQWVKVSLLQATLG